MDLDNKRQIIEIRTDKQVELIFLDNEGKLESGIVLSGFYVKEAMEQHFAKNMKNATVAEYKLPEKKDII